MDYFNSTRVPPGEITDFNSSQDNFPRTSLSYNPLTVIDIVTISIELPVLCWAVFVLYHQVKAGYVIPVYVINLLISDFIQIIGRIFYELADPFGYIKAFARCLMLFGIFASIWFMVCIALERYLLVVHPLWYRCHHTIKHSILISLAVWLSLVLFSIGFVFSLYLHFDITFASYASFFLIPLLLLLFFLGAICRALSHSISVPHEEKKRILGTLALILLIYIVMFCPSIFLMYNLTLSFQQYYILFIVSETFIFLSPLADPLLYILTKRRKTHRENRDTPTVLSENITSV